MMFVDRATAPIPRFFLYSKIHSLRRELFELFAASMEKRSQSSSAFFGGEIGNEIAEDLHSLFRGKCAYCETHANKGRPYCFRPGSEAEPVHDRSASHLYYTWLATSWDNWLWVCDGCRPENEAYFPVQGRRAALPDPLTLEEFASPSAATAERLAKKLGWDSAGPKVIAPPSWSDMAGDADSRRFERNILLDPTGDRELWRHLGVAADGQLVGLSRRGRETIDHFRLQRPNLVAGRAQALSLLVQRRLHANRPVFDESSLLQGAIRLRLRFLVQHMAKAASRRVRLGWPELVESYNALRARPDGERLLRDAMLADPEPPSRHRPAATTARARPAHPPPRLTSLEIENFKSLEKLAVTIPSHARGPGKAGENQAAGCLLVLGENATGKSSILEAAVLCLVDPKTRGALKVNPARLVLDPRFMDEELTGGPSESRLVARFDDGKVRDLRIAGPGSDDRTGAGRSYRGAEDASPLPVFAYGAFRQYLDRAPKRLPADHHVSTLFRTDRLLPNPLPWLLSLNADLFAMVARSLRAIFAVDGDFEVIERDGDTCYLVTDYVHRGTKRRERTPLDIVSSGFRAVLAMACDIMQGLMSGRHAAGFQSLLNARAIVFVDEIEAHLHPRWKIAIMASLREALPNVTFVVTSHDPLCVRGMATGEVLVLNRVRGEEAPGSDLPVFIETLTALPDIEELTIEQLLTADFFQLNSTSSRATDRAYARIADLLRRQREAAAGLAPPLREGEKDALRAFTAEVNKALPVGDTEVQRLVQEAVAQYLQERAEKTREGRARLREATRERILRVLRSA